MRGGAIFSLHGTPPSLVGTAKHRAPMACHAIALSTEGVQDLQNHTPRHHRRIFATRCAKDDKLLLYHNATQSFVVGTANHPPPQRHTAFALFCLPHGGLPQTHSIPQCYGLTVTHASRTFQRGRAKPQHSDVTDVISPETMQRQASRTPPLIPPPDPPVTRRIQCQRHMSSLTESTDSPKRTFQQGHA